MAYIYKIINDVNDKIYIGKTEFSIEKRFKEHCYDAFKNSKEKRPLYSAMKKYGIEHFHIELIEKTDNPIEREKYWIEKLGNFHNGYNATIGGDGKPYIDYNSVIATYLQLQNASKTAKILNIDYSHVLHILDEYNIPRLKHQDVIINNQRAVGCFNDEKLIMSFASMQDAARWLIKNNITKAGIKSVSVNIGRVCRGKRKTAYNYKWKFI